jgi:PAS domain S-box-containing protein
MMQVRSERRTGAGRGARGFSRGLLMLALLLSPILALLHGAPAAATASDDVVVLSDEVETYPLGPHLELLEDPTRSLGIAEVMQPPVASRFATTGQDVPSLGLTRSVWWARVEIDNTGAPDRTWYLVYRQPIVDNITIFVPRPDGGWTSLNGGLLSRGHYFLLDHRYVVFPITLPPDRRTTLHVRIENRDAITLPLTLQTVESLYRADREEQLLFGGLFGVLLTVCVYLFFIWQVMRESSQGWLILMELGIAWYIAAQGGFFAELIWRNAPWWNAFSVQAAAVGMMVCALFFTRHFLRTEANLPRIDLLLRLMTLGIGVLPLLAVINMYAMNTVTPYAAIAGIIGLMVAGAGALRARVDGSAVYILAFSALFVGGMMRSLVDIGGVPVNAFTVHSFPVGAGISAIVFSIGIAGQFKSRQEEKERALRLSNERFSLASDGASTGLYDWDLTRGTIFFSARMTELFGPAPRSASPDRPFWLDLVHPGDAERLASEFRSFLEGRLRTISMDYRVICPDGVLRWVCTTGAAVRDPMTGQVVRLAGSTGDVTETKRAEASLRASESLKSAILNSSLDCIVSTDAEGRIIEFNPAAEQTFGYTRAEVLGRSMADVIVPRHLRERHRDGLRRYLTTGESRIIGRRFEIEAMRRDGTVFPVELAIIEVMRGGDSVFAAFVRDITERRRSEAALRESQRQLAEKSRFLETVLATIAQGICVIDGNLKVRLANERFLEMYDYPREFGTPGTPLDALLRWRAERGDYPPGDVDDLIAERLAQYRSLEEVRREEKRPNNRVIELWRRPMRDGGTVSIFSDVTERKRTEEALRQSEARFRGIAEAHPIPVIISGLEDSRILYVSPRAAAHFGAPAVQLVGIQAEELYPSRQERQRFLAALEEAGEIELMEVMMRRRDGSIFPAALSTRVIEYEGQRAAVTGLYDLTFRKQAEQEIARQRDALHQSEKLAALGSLLAGVAHELNNPLSVVVGQSVLMEEMAADERTRARAAKIHRAADRCARIVRTFLALARRRPPERNEVDFNEIVEASLDLVAYALQADGIEVSLDLADDVPHLWADGDQLNQVVTNLVVNARQAMAERPVDRRLKLTTRFDPQTGTAVLSIADNGPGVPPEIRSRIFEPFFTTKPAGIGTGVGLSMCHNIIDAHGGAIAVEDTPGGGATFAIQLPVPVSVPPAAAKSDQDAAGAIGPYRILIVDDEPEISLTIAEALEPDGHSIDIASNGREALSRIEVEDMPGRGTTYDLVISDLRMPDLDGPGLFAEVRRRWPDLACRFVFITGDTLSVPARGFLTETGVPVIEKPFTAAGLRETIARVFETQEGVRAASDHAAMEVI